MSIFMFKIIVNRAVSLSLGAVGIGISKRLEFSIDEHIAAVFELYPDILCDFLDCSYVFIGLPAVTAVKDIAF